jgi:hypothetical protein
MKKAMRLDMNREVAKERDKILDKQKEAQHFISKAGEAADLDKV